MKTAASIPAKVFKGAEKLAGRVKKSRSRFFAETVKRPPRARRGG
jgi:hypothetical protein